MAEVVVVKYLNDVLMMMAMKETKNYSIMDRDKLKRKKRKDSN